MRRSILIPIAAVAVTIGIVGSGFSAWYFLDRDVSSDAKANISITDKLDGKGYIERAITYIDDNGSEAKVELTDDDKFDMCLDQGSKDILDESNINDSNYNSTGIYFEYDGKYQVKYLHLDYLVSTAMYDALEKQGMSASYNTLITIKSPLSNYISIKDSVSSHQNSPAIVETGHYAIPSGNALMVAINVIGPHTQASKSQETIGETEYYRFKTTLKVGMDSDNANYIFEYKKGKKPSSKEELKSMRNELSSTSEKLLTFNTTVDFIK